MTPFTTKIKIIVVLSQSSFLGGKCQGAKCFQDRLSISQSAGKTVSKTVGQSVDRIKTDI